MEKKVPEHERFKIVIFYGEGIGSITMIGCTDLQFSPVGLQFVDSERRIHIIAGGRVSYHISQHEPSPTDSGLMIPPQEILIPR